MASLIENLITILDNESSEYDKLLRLSMDKTPVIIAGALEELQKITDEEQVVVSTLLHLEKKRMELMQDIANVTNRDVKELKLNNLVQMLGSRPGESQRLAQVHDKLKQVTGEMQRVNAQNRELIANALEMVEFDMNLLQSVKTAPMTANYTKGAFVSGSAIGTERGGFDAKQ